MPKICTNNPLFSSQKFPAADKAVLYRLIEASRQGLFFRHTSLKSVKRTRKLLQSAFFNARQEREITFFYTFALVSMNDHKNKHIYTMKKLIALFCLLAFVIGVQAQRKVSLQDVAQGTYRAENIYGIKPMLDGEFYTQMSADKKRIVKYSFKTGKEVGTVFNVTTARDCPVKTFDDYIMSPDEKLILIQTESIRKLFKDGLR